MKDLSYARIHKSQEYLSPLGNIGYRALFGGYSLFVEDVIFAMVSEGELYLRACEQSAIYFTQKAAPVLMYYKRGRPIALNYYLVDDELWRNPDQLVQLSSQALRAAQRVRSLRKSCTRLKDLPNLSLSIEIMLHEVGIDDFRTLQVIGAKRTWLKLRRIRKQIGVKMLLALAGAISGVHEAVLPAKTRQELTAWWMCYEQRLRRHSA